MIVIMKKKTKKIFLASIFIIILLMILFSIVSVFHAYSFTHPVSSRKGFNPKSMDISFAETAIVTVFGVRPERKIESGLPSDYGLKYENVSFSSKDGIRLKGWLIKAKNPKATIILAHGWGGNKEGLINYSAFLNKNGYNTLLFDFRGFGKSDGNYTTLGYYEKFDVFGAVDYLKSRKDVDENKIGAYGFSMGGAAIVMAAKENNSFKAMVFDGLYPTIHQNAARRFKEVYGFPKFPFATSLVFFGGLIHGFNAFDLAPIKYVDDIESPILFIQAANDTQVSVDDAYSIYYKANEPKDILIVENALHSKAHLVAKEEYEKKVINFYDKYLGQGTK